jgi:tripartite-type tricarboxylate transporter receptor subunit TctC
MAELGYPDIQVDSYFVLYAPPSLPASAVRKLNQELNRVLERTETQARFAELGAATLPVAPEESRRLVQAEAHQFSELIRSTNIKAD